MPGLFHGFNIGNPFQPRVNPYSHFSDNELIACFHENTFPESDKLRQDLLQEMCNRYCDARGVDNYPQVSIRYDMDDNNLGGYTYDAIELNGNYLDNPFETLDTIIHETNHHCQKEEKGYTPDEISVIRAEMTEAGYSQDNDSKAYYEAQGLELDSNNKAFEFVSSYHDEFKNEPRYQEYLNGREAYFNRQADKFINDRDNWNKQEKDHVTAAYQAGEISGYDYSTAISALDYETAGFRAEAIGNASLAQQLNHENETAEEQGTANTSENSPQPQSEDTVSPGNENNTPEREQETNDSQLTAATATGLSPLEQLNERVNNIMGDGNLSNEEKQALLTDVRNEANAHPEWFDNNEQETYDSPKVLTRDPQELHDTLSRGIDQILEAKEMDYQDKGYSPEEIQERLAQDRKDLEEEFLGEKYFPSENNNNENSYQKEAPDNEKQDASLNDQPAPEETNPQEENVSEAEGNPNQTQENGTEQADNVQEGAPSKEVQEDPNPAKTEEDRVDEVNQLDQNPNPNETQSNNEDLEILDLNPSKENTEEQNNEDLNALEQNPQPENGKEHTDEDLEVLELNPKQEENNNEQDELDASENKENANDESLDNNSNAPENKENDELSELDRGNEPTEENTATQDAPSQGNEQQSDSSATNTNTSEPSEENDMSE